MKELTISLSEDVANWAREKAAKENTPLSRLVGRILEKEMLESDDFQDAYRRWQKIEAIDIDAANPLAREDAHARR